jgi:hypothetical protein
MADLNSTPALLFGQLVSEPLLRYVGWMRLVWFVCQVTAHPHASWGIEIECSDTVWDRLAAFRHVQHAILRADWRNSNGLRECRHADGHGSYSREFIEGVHFEILRKRSWRCTYQLSKILIVEIDNPIGDPLSGISSVSSVLDLALTAFKEINWFGALVAKPIS